MSTSTKNSNGSCHVPHHFLAQLFNALYAELFHKDRPQIAQQLLNSMVLLLSGEIEEGNALKDWGRPRYCAEKEKDAEIQRALMFMEEYLDQHLTIEKVARHVFMSPTTFTYLFKKETGHTFQEHQTQ